MTWVARDALPLRLPLRPGWRRRAPSLRYCGNVAVIGATTTAEHPQRGQERTQRDVARGESGRVAFVELDHIVELGMAERRRVGAQPTDARGPRRFALRRRYSP